MRNDYTYTNDYTCIYCLYVTLLIEYIHSGFLQVLLSHLTKSALTPLRFKAVKLQRLCRRCSSELVYASILLHYEWKYQALYSDL